LWIAQDPSPQERDLRRTARVVNSAFADSIFQARPSREEVVSYLADREWPSETARRVALEMADRFGQCPQEMYDPAMQRVLTEGLDERSYAEARRLAEYAHMIDPDDPRSDALLGAVLFRCRQIDDALAVLEDDRRFDGPPSQRDQRQGLTFPVRSWFLLRALVATGRGEEAARLLVKVQDAAPATGPTGPMIEALRRVAESAVADVKIGRDPPHQSEERS
ncbi:MAG: tetratricopeptide repeat protein, partial [Planctomycetota bacterium]